LTAPFRAFGFENSPFVLQKEKGAYLQQDMTRVCRKYGLAPWRMPSVFPRLSVLPLRIVLLGAEQALVGAFSRKVMELNFALDRDISQPDRMAPILGELCLPAADILAQAQSDTIKTRLREQTDEARARNIRRADLLCRPRNVLGQRPAGRRSAARVRTDLTMNDPPRQRRQLRVQAANPRR
jgi:2-hydroxychromene-2-carboxylate isomerase